MAFEKKLMLKNQVLEYQSKADPNSDDPTIFVLKTISAEDMLVAKLMVGNSLDVEGKITDEARAIKWLLYMCSKGIAEIKNFKGLTWAGYNAEVQSILIETNLVFEIGRKIYDLNSVKEQEKN